MASHIYPTPEVYRTVTRPITMDIIREVLSMTGINPDDFRTKMLGYAENETVPGSTLNNNDKERPNRLATDEKLTMEISEEDVGDNVTAVRYPNHVPVFHDPKLKITMKPVLSLSKTTISVVINVPSRVRASNWLFEIKRRIYQNQMTNFHTVEYHYPIPKPYTYYLLQMHKMREHVEGLNESFGEWCKRCFTNRWTVISNLEGNEKLLAIQECQTNIYGWFNFDFEPEKPEKSSDNPSGWEIKFDYTFHYQRPDMMVFSYPLMIHNQLLPLDMIDTDTKDNIESYNRYQGATYDAYDDIVSKSNPYGNSNPIGLSEPIFDDWLAPDNPPYSAQLIRALIHIDPNDKKWAINLDNISDNFALKDYMISYMKKVNTKMLHLNNSIFYIRLYRWDSIISYPDIDIDVDLKVTSTVDMTLVDMWHVVLYINIDPSKLLPSAWDDLMDEPYVVRDWLDAIGVNDSNNPVVRGWDPNDPSTWPNYNPNGGNGGNSSNGQFDPNDPSTWPNYNPNDPSTWPNYGIDEDKLKDLNGGNGNGGGSSSGITPGLPVTNEKYTAGFTIIAMKGDKNAAIDSN